MQQMVDMFYSIDDFITIYCYQTINTKYGMLIVILYFFSVTGTGYTTNVPRGKQNFPMLRGVNRSGTEYACIEGKGIFDGPSDETNLETTIRNMKKWNINVVRVPLNEGCWLGKNVPNAEYAGDNYKAAIKDWVERLRKHGLYVIVDLHWTEGVYKGKDHGKCLEMAANCHKPMPDVDLATNFWREVATMFKSDEGVMFDLFNEPFPERAIEDLDKAWTCWRDGGDACSVFDFRVVGMQELVNVVRKTGAKNLILLGGLSFANDLEKWRKYLPEDSENNLAASAHIYDNSGCRDEACWDRGIGDIIISHPVVVGAFGEKGCSHSFIDTLLPYLEKKGISYLGWTWNNWGCELGPSLISSDDGEPTAYGIGLKTFLEKVTTPRGKQNFPMLRGVNRSGTEYACIEGKGIFDGPSDEATLETTIRNMKKWNINVVRVPLNEGCWFGSNVKFVELAGEKYKTDIKKWVEQLRKHGLYVIVELHWTEGKYGGKDRGKYYEQAANCQKPMPDKLLAPSFWQEVATMFKSDEGVIFDLFNEPFPDRDIDDLDQAWACWRDGGDACSVFEFPVVGMQELVNVVRKTEAKNLIMLGGLSYANDLKKWKEYLPEDSENNIAASAHIYNFNDCKTRECWDSGIGKIIETHPVIVGEIGERGCTHKFIDTLMPYLEEKGISYLGWTWNNWVCTDGPSLIKTNDGEASEFGIGFKDFLAKYTM